MIARSFGTILFTVSGVRSARRREAPGVERWQHHSASYARASSSTRSKCSACSSSQPSPMTFALPFFCFFLGNSDETSPGAAFVTLQTRRRCRKSNAARSGGSSSFSLAHSISCTKDSSRSGTSCSGAFTSRSEIKRPMESRPVSKVASACLAAGCEQQSKTNEMRGLTQAWLRRCCSGSAVRKPKTSSSALISVPTAACSEM
mmetsp:Transcript_49883/g.106624  ORF Transcript_49883/g.106624 Transcript_49883/m.106624 type:complete len:203 (-) Transcript_49883:429-1037(-)